MSRIVVTECNRCKTRAEGNMPDGWHLMTVKSLASDMADISLCPGCWPYALFSEVLP